LIYKNIEITSREVLGFLLIFGPLQFMLAIVIGEGMLPNYHPGIHYVSTLGVGETALIFSGSVIVLGACMVISSYFAQKEYHKTLFSALMLISGICALGVGFFPENSRPLHGIFTGLTFLFAAFFLISSITVERKPILVLPSILGLLILIMSLVFLPYLGLDVESTELFMGFLKGTLERFVIYPTLAGVIFLGGYLSNNRT
jgi:hypothetical membrane protein